MTRMLGTALVAAVLALGCGESAKETSPTIAPGTKINPAWEKVGTLGPQTGRPASRER